MLLSASIAVVRGSIGPNGWFGVAYALTGVTIIVTFAVAQRAALAVERRSNHP